ncbi:MAG: 23S rRNA (adenine(2503)-C(2))-methyltransferase RlmN [Clostridia bacterium]|nr:23S rRNA (adenine(2503)-C(2))-methyltransferase RlmN [Clostridia bacterium]
MIKDCLLDYNLSQLADRLAQYQLKSYQISQIYQWLIKGVDFLQMTNLPKALREQLANDYDSASVRVIKTLTSTDSTTKYLMQLRDDNVIECVVMKYKYGNTLCISTQVGCRMGCAFCASTLGGLVRNLSAGEMLGQVVVANKLHHSAQSRGITNIVLMGSGEPLDNYDNVLSFLTLVNAQEGLNISMRNISLSTCGLVPQINKLAECRLGVNLTISLHSAFDDSRRKIMPIANKYSISQIINSAKYYFECTGRRVIFEYTLIEGVNDRREDALQLARLLSGMSAHVNLIRLNQVKERHLTATTTDKAKEFLALLEQLHLSATLRRSMGGDIAGACGQLRYSYINTNADRNTDNNGDSDNNNS